MWYVAGALISENSHARVFTSGSPRPAFSRTGRNDYSSTFAAAYAVRARPWRPCLGPGTWEEVERGELRREVSPSATLAQRIENCRRPLVRPAQDETIAAVADRAVGLR